MNTKLLEDYNNQQHSSVSLITAIVTGYRELDYEKCHNHVATAIHSGGKFSFNCWFKCPT
jgi:hypothetical protein